MKIIEMDINQVVPYVNNPRNNDEAAILVANSIREFGFLQPIIVDENNVVIAGHTRLKAARMLGLKMIPVQVAKLTEEQARAFRLADNKVGELSSWDQQKLHDEIEAIAGLDMSDFGFTLTSDAVKEVKIGSSGEFDIEDFADEAFRHECEACGFRWN